jgi:deazaflavin-dependent oxidoreductase (nitroreductase family)
MEATIGDRLQKVADRSTLQVTHIGRKSGNAHQVTIWFVVQGGKVLLPTSNIDRNWVRNLRKTPHVELSIGADKFSGDAHFLENAADRERVRAMIQRKYRVGGPILTLLELLARFGLGTFKYGAFEVSLSRRMSAGETAGSGRPEELPRP